MSTILAGICEVNVHGNGNWFYRAMALAVDDKTDHSYALFQAMCNKMIAEYPKVFEAYQFSSIYRRAFQEKFEGRNVGRNDGHF